MLYSYSYACIIAKGIKTVPNTGTTAAPNNRNKEALFKQCVPSTDCISERSKKQVDNAKYIDVEYSKNY